MTDPTTDENAARRTGRAPTSPTDSPRAADQTGDAARGTARGRGRDRWTLEYPQNMPLPADRHER
jgi:hypothetical protein